MPWEKILYFPQFYGFFIEKIIYLEHIYFAIVKKLQGHHYQQPNSFGLDFCINVKLKENTRIKIVIEKLFKALKI